MHLSFGVSTVLMLSWLVRCICSGCIMPSQSFYVLYLLVPGSSMDEASLPCSVLHVAELLQTRYIFYSGEPQNVKLFTFYEKQQQQWHLLFYVFYHESVVDTSIWNRQVCSSLWLQQSAWSFNLNDNSNKDICLLICTCIYNEIARVTTGTLTTCEGHNRYSVHLFLAASNVQIHTSWIFGCKAALL